MSSYAPGVPADIDLPEGSLAHLIDDSVATYGKHVALEFFGATTTYAELGDQIARAAEGLRRLGVRKGDRVALVLPNCPQHVVAFYAVAAARRRRRRAQPALHAARAPPPVRGPRRAGRDRLGQGRRDRAGSARRPRRHHGRSPSTSPAAMPASKRFALRLPVRGRAQGPRAADHDRCRGTITWEKLLDTRAAQGAVSAPRARRPRADPVHQRHDRACPKGAMLSHRNLGVERSAGARLGARDRARHLGRLRRAPAVPRLRADPVPHLRDEHGLPAGAVPEVRPRPRARRRQEAPADVPARGAADLRAARRPRRRSGRCRSAASTSRSPAR